MQLCKIIAKLKAVDALRELVNRFDVAEYVSLINSLVKCEVDQAQLELVLVLWWLLLTRQVFKFTLTFIGLLLLACNYHYKLLIGYNLCTGRAYRIAPFRRTRISLCSWCTFTRNITTCSLECSGHKRLVTAASNRQLVDKEKKNVYQYRIFLQAVNILFVRFVDIKAEHRGCWSSCTEGDCHANRWCGTGMAYNI